MAEKTVTIAGVIYPDVPSLSVTKQGGGSAAFVEVSDTTAVAADVAQGKYFYGADGVKREGTASGGGGYTLDDVAVGTAVASGIITLETATKVKDYAFAGWTGFDTVHAKNATTLNGYAFRSTGIRCFVGEKRITGTNYNVFSSCPHLAILDIDASATFSNGYLQNCSALATIILRRNNGITNIASSAHLNGTPFAEGGTGGTLYVPAAYKATYESNTNWSAILARENNRILTIEGSIYESYYGDGTPIA